uniref:Family with sequence similarity 151 member B n=1 Tax=Equus caballus TaxID=9796 RepID=A0A9L0S4P9_HORSE
MWDAYHSMVCQAVPGSWSENILEYFLRSNQITAEDGAQITWYHAANHKAQVNEALKSESGRTLVLTLDGGRIQLFF